MTNFTLSSDVIIAILIFGLLSIVALIITGFLLYGLYKLKKYFKSNF